MGLYPTLAPPRLYPRENRRRDEGAGVSFAGVPLLDSVSAFSALYPNARLLVEFGWGANPLGDPSAWSWTDASADVLCDEDGIDAISISPMGRSDASVRTQYARAGFTLDNRSGNYSDGAQSINYPNVVLNVPLRISVNLTGIPNDTLVQFQGNVDMMTPSWDSTGQYAVVNVTASGIMRRLDHGTDPRLSALARGIATQALTPAPYNSRPMRYWTFEDGPASTQAAEYFGGPALVPSGGSVSWAADSSFLGSAPLPQFGQGVSMTGSIPSYTAPAPRAWRIEFAFRVASAPSADATLFSWHTTGGDANSWRFRWDNTASTFKLQAYDDTGAETLGDAPGTTMDLTLGSWFVVIQAVQTGGKLWTYWTVFDANVTSTTDTNFTSSSVTLGRLKDFTFAVDAPFDGVTFGHLAFLTGVYFHADLLYFDVVDDVYYATGWSGFESPISRLVRICREESIVLNVTGSDTSPIVAMGPQTTMTLMDQLRESETADAGMLGDGLGPGLYFIANSSRYNQNAVMTLDASASDLVPPFVALLDDSATGNTLTMSLKDGTSAMYSRADGLVGTARIGKYNAVTPSTEANLSTVTDLFGLVSFTVGLQSQGGYRYPTLMIDLRRRPAFAPIVAAMRPGKRITVQNVNSYVPQHPPGDLDLIVEGWSMRLSRFMWDVAYNVSKYQPYSVGVIEGLGGATSPRLRIDTSASTLAADVSASDTTWLVATTDATILADTATYPGDFPVSLQCEGEAVSCTNVAGTSSPQTLTVTRATNGTTAKAHGPGAAVKLISTAPTLAK